LLRCTCAPHVWIGIGDSGLYSTERSRIGAAALYCSLREGHLLACTVHVRTQYRGEEKAGEIELELRFQHCQSQTSSTSCFSHASCALQKKRKEKKRKEKKKVRLIFFLTFELHAWFACTAACKSFRVGARGFAFLRICLGLRVGAVCGLRENDVGAGPQIFFFLFP